MDAYSVLMSVYYKVDPEHFELAIKSMIEQTWRTNDFVIVCDGKLTPELDRVLDRYMQEYSEIIRVIRLEKNVGIGAAANIGLRECRNDLVAKMDADDIAVPARCEKQVKRFFQCPELTVLGGDIAEFEKNPDEPVAVRAVPRTNEDIRSFARRRNPFNNVAIMYRRKAVLAVGGYRGLRRSEDFDLCIRLLHAGYYCENLDEILVCARVNSDTYGRRGSWATLKGYADTQWCSYRMGYASLLDFCVSVIGAMVLVLSPMGLRKLMYRLFLRK